MKNFVSPSFFRLFDLLMSTYNPALKRAHWTLDGVDCWRERHSYTGRLNGFVVETFTFTRHRAAWLDANGGQGILVDRRRDQSTEDAAMGSPISGRAATPSRGFAIRRPCSIVPRRQLLTLETLNDGATLNEFARWMSTGPISRGPRS